MICCLPPDLVRESINSVRGSNLTVVVDRFILKLELEKGKRNHSGFKIGTLLLRVRKAAHTGAMRGAYGESFENVAEVNPLILRLPE